MPRARQSLRQNATQRAAFGESWWFTCSAESRKPSRPAQRCRQSSSATESTPPESPTARRSPGLTQAASRAATRPARSTGSGAALLFLLDFLELAMADELLEALLEQPVERGFLELPPGFLQRLLDGLHRRLMVAVRAAGRLGYDAVHQSEGFQAGRGNGKRLGRFLGVIGALPQDRGAAFGRDHRVGRILQHENGIPNGNGQSSARA